MLAQVNNSKIIKEKQINREQISPNSVGGFSVFLPPQFPHQSKFLSRTQPIVNLSSKHHHKKPASNTKYLTSKNAQSAKQESSTTQINLQDEDIVKIISQSENLIANNQLIEGINLLKAIKDPSIKFSNYELKIVVLMNLAVAYYQIGFLQEAFEEFSALASLLNHLAFFLTAKPEKLLKKLLYLTLEGKVQLQICILFSEMGKHQQALKHAKKSCKLNFELIYDVLNYLCEQQLIKLSNNDYNQQIIEKNQNLTNNIVLLEHLHKLIGDLNEIFNISEKIKLSKDLLFEIKKIIPYYKTLKVNMELLFHEKLSDQQNNDNYKELSDQQKNENQLDWIFRNKILDQIQLKSLTATFFHKQLTISNPYIIQKITYLAISFYCYSTEIRFIEKSNKNSDNCEVMDSQHWLSRSLEIAYSFMPPDAPILNQILTVHDRFHGIDKQTIPEDKEICGYFKVLKPLSKPKSIYSSKSHICSPIMIRIQPPKITIDIDDINQEIDFQLPTRKINRELQQRGQNLEIEAFSRNNKIRGMNTKIKILQFNNSENKQIENIKIKKININDQPKIYTRSTISNLSTLQTQKEKKIRFSKIYKTNHSTISDKFKEFELEPKSFTQLDGKAIISEDLLHRPHSQDKGMSKWQKIQATAKAYSTQNTKRRKSLPSRNKQKLEKIVYNGAVKFDGLKLTGKRLNQTFEIDPNFLEKLNEAHNNEENIFSESERRGGNIFISNNINLFISKGKADPKTSREGIELKDQISRRQKFISKRRLSHLNIYPTEQFHL